MRCAYLGDENSHTHAACKVLAPEAEYIGFKTVRAVAEAVVGGECDICVLPAENSVEGAVTATEDALIELPLFITAATTLPIHHSLITLPNVKLSETERVYSHPQALAQCSLWLSKNLPKAECIAVHSTSYALGLVHDDKTAAVAAGAIEGLTAAAEEIEDFSHNATRFLLLNREPCGTGRRASVVFGAENRPGGLLGVLKLFERAEMNMTRIESRPSKAGLGDYVFFVDFTLPEGEKGDAALNGLLRTLRSDTAFSEFLGRYDDI